MLTHIPTTAKPSDGFGSLTNSEHIRYLFSIQGTAPGNIRSGSSAGGRTVQMLLVEPLFPGPLEI